MNNEIKNFSREQKMKLLAVVIMSDGSIHYRNGTPNSFRLNTSKESKQQHELFSYLSQKVFQKKPKVYFGSNYLLSELFSIEGSRELLRLSPTFKTTPDHNQSNSAYLKSEQPTLRFLFSEPEDAKWAALRIYFDFDGNVSPAFKLKKKMDLKNDKIYTYYQVQFECEIQISETNPNLIIDLMKLCSDLNLKARIKKDKRNWSKIGGIIISNIDSAKRFLNFGPITNVNVSSKSRNRAGVSKKIIAKAALDYLNKADSFSKYFTDKKEATKYRNYLSRKFSGLLMKC